jgi:transposase
MTMTSTPWRRIFAKALSPRSLRRRWTAKSRPTRSTSSPGTRETPLPFKKRSGRAAPTAQRSRGTLEKEKPPILGLIQRDGQVVLRMLPNVKQKTIKPIIEATIVKGTMIYTDEYSIYARLPVWGYQHKTVCHSRGEYARDEDGDGFHEVHVNTMEGCWSLLRSWLRPHRGISQEKLPIYLGFFQFIHNTRKRGKALLGALVGALVA